MSLLPASSIGDESTGFYNGVIGQSARFEDNDNSRLSKSWSSAGNRKIWTLSWWMKRSNLGEKTIFSSPKSASENGFTVYFPDDKLEIFEYRNTSRTSTFGATTDMVFRDTTNWYHCVIYWQTDTYSSDADSVRLYVNGSQVNLNFRNDGVGADYESVWWNNSSYTQYIGGQRANSQNFDGYIAEVNFIDGQALTPSNFGETKNGVWIPKSYTGSYGTNGFRFTFADSSSLGDDTSGNTNDFAVSGLAATDVVKDSPENNFATLSPLRSGENASSQTFKEGNLEWTSSAYGYNSTGSTINVPTSGKWYFEVYVKLHGTGESHDFGPGLQGVKLDSMSKSDPATATYGDSTHYITRRDFGSRIEKNLGNVYIGNNPGTGEPDESDSVVNYNQGKIVQLAFDADSGKVYWGLDNTYWDDDVSTDGNPSSGTNETTSLTTGVEYFFTLQQYSNTYTSVTNFGQDSSFAGNKTSGSANGTDANGIGDFYYNPPTGFLALCSSNLPDTNLSPAKSEQADDYFNTVLYNGDGNSTNDITVGFKPDWTWIKERTSDGSHIANHVLVDSSRGYENFLVSSSSQAESSGVTGDNNTRSSDGFQTTNSGASNQSGQPYVAWNWRLNGGTTSSDTNGTKTTAVQFNANAGISIATYTNVSQGNHTFGHGLGSKPEAFIWKARNTTMNWIWWDSRNFTDADRDGKYFNSTIGFTSGSNWVTDVTDTTINITDGQVSSGNNINYWCISFKSVEGFSRIGNYTGNGSTDGTFIYLGFRPAWFLLKRIDANANWLIYDNKRDPDNRVAQGLFPNLGGAETEQTGGFVDFVSNGVKCREDGSAMNASGGTFVYLAFAEQPFKFSNAR
jgi:hypothetical protein